MTAIIALELAGLLLLMLGCLAVLKSFQLAREAERLDEGRVTPKEPWR